MATWPRFCGNSCASITLRQISPIAPAVATGFEDQAEHQLGCTPALLSVRRETTVTSIGSQGPFLLCYVLCYNRAMPRKNLPPYVQRVTRPGKPTRFRGWAMIAGKRRFGPVRDDALVAHRDAVHMRGFDEGPAWGGTFESRTEEWLLAIKDRLTPDTLEYYRGKLKAIWRTIPKSIALERVSAAALSEFVRAARAEHDLSARTIQHCRRVLNTFFAWCVRRNLVSANPVQAVAWPKPQDTPPDVLNEVELAGMLARITDPWAADLAVAMAYTGLRRGEVARLELRDIDLDGDRLWVRGKARAQAHPIPADALPAVRRLVAAADGREFLIPGPHDKARRSKIAETFRAWQRKLGDTRWHPHTLRHSVATIMLRKGVAAPTVQRFLRHSSFAMTQRYVHLVEADVHAAAQRLRLVPTVDDAAQHG